MKTLMITAATSALMLGMAACSEPADDIETENAEYGETETADAGMDENGDENLMDAETDASEMPADVTYLARGEMSGEELIGAEVMGSDGEQIAVVDDLLLNSSGQVESLIFRASDVFDFAGDKGALPYGEADLTMMEDDEARFSVSMTDEAIQNVAEFDQDGMNDYSLVSEMIGTMATLSDSDDSARIEDVILDQSGMVKSAIIADPGIVGQQRIIAFDRISVGGEGDSEIMIDATAEEIDGLPVFEYSEDEMAGGTTMSDDEMEPTDDMDTDDMSDGDMDEDSDMTTPQ